MKWDDTARPKIKPYHKWFAWYPVLIDGYKYWLCWVERDTYYAGWGMAHHYRLPERKMNQKLK